MLDIWWLPNEYQQNHGAHNHIEVFMCFFLDIIYVFHIFFGHKIFYIASFVRSFCEMLHRIVMYDDRRWRNQDCVNWTPFFTVLFVWFMQIKLLITATLKLPVIDRSSNSQVVSLQFRCHRCESYRLSFDLFVADTCSKQDHLK